MRLDKRTKAKQLRLKNSRWKEMKTSCDVSIKLKGWRGKLSQDLANTFCPRPADKKRREKKAKKKRAKTVKRHPPWIQHRGHDKLCGPSYWSSRHLGCEDVCGVRGWGWRAPTWVSGATDTFEAAGRVDTDALVAARWNFTLIHIQVTQSSKITGRALAAEPEEDRGRDVLLPP